MQKEENKLKEQHDKSNIVFNDPESSRQLKIKGSIKEL